MKPFFFCCILFLLILTKAVSQDVRLQKTSLGSGELHHALTSKSLNVSAIIGQPSPINHFQKNGLHLLQGFKTPYLSFINSVESKKVSVYPNPTFGKISIQWKDDRNSKSLTIQLIDVSGKVVDERLVKKDRNTVELDYF
jgi:hypothetical protein